MRKTFFIIILIISLYTIPDATAAAGRDVIIGYHQKPEKVEHDEITNSGGKIKYSYHIIHAISARIPDEAAAKIKNNPKIAFIENDTIFQAMEDEYDSSWGVKHIGSRIVHDNGINGTDVKIAVLDTGIDYNHEDLSDNYRGGIGFVADAGGNVNQDPFDDSYNSHGTHVAGIIGARKNGLGVVGVAPNADIYAVKVLDGGGFGSASWVIAGIEWALDNNMDIITMSFGSSELDPELESLRIACENASNSGVMLIASGGNTYGGTVTYPARYDSVIAVTAVDALDQKASFSPAGPEIELSAPGVNVLSTIRGGYGILSGTSMAAPHAAATAALIISSPLQQDMNGDNIVNNSDVRLRLRNVTDLGAAGRDDIYGYGLVNAEAAVFGVSEQSPIIFIINRTHGPEIQDSKNVSLSDAFYNVTIKNHGLNKVEVDFYDQGIKIPELSLRYKFNRSGPHEVSFNIDVIGKTYDVTFTPFGKPSSFAEIIINPLEVY